MSIEIEMEHIINFSMFKNIQKAELKPMFNCIGANSISYEKGEFISLSGDMLHNVGVVCKGNVHMIKEDIWGAKSIFVIMHEGDIFGETFICSKSFAASVSFVAATACTILFMPFSRVLHSCSSTCSFHHNLIRNMVELIAQKNIQYIEKLEITSKKTIHEKVLTYLSQQVQACGEKYFISPFGRLELADYLCVDRSALTRELSNLKKAGIIDYDKNTYRLLKIT